VVAAPRGLVAGAVTGEDLALLVLLLVALVELLIIRLSWRHP
jgi:hypothetical protein